MQPGKQVLATKSDNRVAVALGQLGYTKISKAVRVSSPTTGSMTCPQEWNLCQK